MEAPIQRCANCRHLCRATSQIIGEVVGECFAFPPTPIAVMTNKGPAFATARPLVNGNDYCAQWCALEVSDGN